MKAIINKHELPKFLVVTKEINEHSFNNYLTKPFKVGEIVKVASFEEQIPHQKADISLKDFRRNYVKVIRKDADGNWGLIDTASWRHFNLLNNKNK